MIHPTIKRWEMGGILFLLVVGTLWHFLFAWTGYVIPLAWLWPVNESVWEHLKLSIVPILLWLAVEYHWLRKAGTNILWAKGIEIIFATGLVVGIFYTYTAITGESILVVDIATFYIGLIGGQLIAMKLTSGEKNKRYLNIIGLVILATFVIAIVWFTYSPPNLPLFIDSNTGTPGMVIE